MSAGTSLGSISSARRSGRRLLALFGGAVVQRRPEREILLGRRCVVQPPVGPGQRGTAELDAARRRRRRPAEREHLGGLPFHLEVEGQLARPCRDAGAENRPERDAALQVGVDLPDDGDVGKSDETLAPATSGGSTRPHFCSVLKRSSRTSGYRPSTSASLWPTAWRRRLLWGLRGSRPAAPPRERYPSHRRVSTRLVEVEASASTDQLIN